MRKGRSIVEVAGSEASFAGLNFRRRRVADPAVFSANATAMRHEDYLRYDRELLKIARENLTGIQDLIMHGLVEPMPGWGVYLSLWERQSEVRRSSVDMEPGITGDYDRLTFDQVGVPLPVYHMDWQLHDRALAASQLNQHPLSMDTMSAHSEVITEDIEEALFKGLFQDFEGDMVPFKYAGNTVWGYTNFPQRKLYTIPHGWNSAQANPVKDLLAMYQILIDNNMYGMYMVYVAKNLWSNLFEDYSTEKGDRTMYERLRACPSVIDVKPTPYMADNTVLCVVMSRKCVDLAIAEQLKNMQYDMGPSMANRFKILACLAVRLKHDQNNQSGIVHATV